ncbi:hypothetical protein U2I54_03740 [Bacillus pseudomycoides]|uniref:Uncharacterized protein n=1 Tax=Bacillus bingmayongensis TaxID=1150157 RepID=A0ABU5JS29_9BACI|nr:hypothetical protein [Bacillus pseudomycoides]
MILGECSDNSFDYFKD